jgi:DNA-binding LacI/PurR family transcriptional regulator
VKRIPSSTPLAAPRAETATIEDVARAARVSISTVSNALNGRMERMRSDTLARIEAAIARLGYRPNNIARQLKTGHTPLLGFLVPSIANPAYGMLAREVEIAAQELPGYRVLLGNTYRSRDKEASFFDDLLSQGVRGVIVISSLKQQDHLDAAVTRGLIAVSYDRRAPGRGAPTVDYVSMNNHKAAQIATAHLIARGHTRIAFATPDSRTMSRSEKIAGFFTALGAAGLGRSAGVLEGESRTGFGDAEMAELGRVLARGIVAGKTRPTAIVAVNDMLAIGMIGELRARGIRVPEDLSVVGMDDLFLSPLLVPPLTTVRPPLRDMARTMVERIVNRLADPTIPPQEFLFEPALVSRDTVGAPALSGHTKRSA